MDKLFLCEGIDCSLKDRCRYYATEEKIKSNKNELVRIYPTLISSEQSDCCCECYGEILSNL